MQPSQFITPECAMPAEPDSDNPDPASPHRGDYAIDQQGATRAAASPPPVEPTAVGPGWAEVIPKGCTNATLTLGGPACRSAGPSAGGTVSVRPREGSFGPPAGDRDAPDASDEPTHHYELIEQLGAGGMGVVLAARQTSCDRIVALKVLKEELREGTTSREAFLSEAAVTAELEHPNIPPLYDLGHSPGGDLYYAMKRVAGRPWSLDFARRPISENLEVLLAVSNAVAFAHSRGVIHRDLKPSNIMLGDFGEVYLMDWGLAVAAHPEEVPPGVRPKAGELNRRNVTGGTPAYMAPEMAQADPGRIGMRSDVYLLGAILFEIVTGQRPHRGASVLECLAKAASNAIVPVDADGELMRIAYRAMATKPEDRYADARAFAAAIRDYQAHAESLVLADEAEAHAKTARSAGRYEDYARSLFAYEEAVSLWPENARARSGMSVVRVEYARCAFEHGDLELAQSLLNDAGEDQAEFRAQVGATLRQRAIHARRLRLMTRAAAILAAAVCVVVAVAFFRIQHERSLALTARDEARAQRDKAAAAEAVARTESENVKVINAFLQDMLESADPARMGLDVSVLDVLEAASARAQRSAGHSPELQQQLHLTLGSTFAALSRFEQAQSHLERALSAADSGDGSFDLLVRQRLGALKLQQFQLREAEELLTAALDDQLARLGPVHREVITTHRLLVQTVIEAGRLAQAGPALEQLREAAAAVPRLPLDERIAIELVRGRWLYLTGQRKRAAAVHRETRSLCERELGPLHPQTMDCRLRAIEHLHEAGEHALVLDELEEFCRAQATHAGEQDVMLLAARVLRARSCYWRGDFVRAREELRAVRAVSLQRLGPDHLIAVDCAIALAAVLDHAPALDLANETRARCERSLGAGHPLTIECLVRAGKIHYSRGRLDEAIAAFDAAIERGGHTLGCDHHDVLIARMFRAQCLGQTVGIDEAVAELRDLEQRIRRRTGPDHPPRILALSMVANLEAHRGHLSQALGLLAEATQLAQERFTEGQWLRRKLERRLDESLGLMRKLRRVNCAIIAADGTAPVIDGRDDDPAWQIEHRYRAYDAWGLLDRDDHTHPPVDTQATLVADARRLYGVIRCPVVGGEVPPCTVDSRDGAVWQDDAVEVRWRPQGDEQPMRLAVNAAGVIADLRGEDPEATLDDVRVACARNGEGWVLEWSVPWSALGFDERPPEGTTIPFDLIRYHRAEPEFVSRWQQLDPQRPALEQFGRLQVGEWTPDPALEAWRKQSAGR
ncbi:MAG: protein kinase domain-containing protein [Planctomycetota bacterium]